MNRINAITGAIEHVPEIIEVSVPGGPREGVFIPEDVVTEIDDAPVIAPIASANGPERSSRQSTNPLSGLMNLFSPRRDGHHDGGGKGDGLGGLLGGLGGLFGGGKGEGLGGLFGGGKGEGLSGLLGGGLGGILERLSPDKLETEDLMLMMILYFLYRESGDSELLIIMAAMFFLD